MNKVYIRSAKRSAVSPKGADFADLSLHELAQPVITGALASAGIPASDVGELIVSNAVGPGGNPARSIALAAGLPQHIAGLTIDRQCAGGLDALILAASMIRSGLHDVVIAGGVESYSRRPIRMKTFADHREPEAYDQAPFTPWPDRDPQMAVAAHELALQLGISKAAQDEWAITSHEKALNSTLQGSLEEIVSINNLSHDRFTRSLNPKLCRRAPIVHESISAANMAIAGDGAAFCVLVSDRYKADSSQDKRDASRFNIEYCDGVSLGDNPVMPGTAPIAATQALFARQGLCADDLQAAEIMEAFSVQAMACCEGIGIDPNIVNCGGGALSRGHPIGASGAILAVRLFHEMQTKQGYGLATIAAAGGVASSVLMITR